MSSAVSSDKASAGMPYFADATKQRYVYNTSLVNAIMKDFRYAKSVVASAAAPQLPEYTFEEIGRGAFAVAYKVLNSAGKPVYVLKHILKTHFEMDLGEVNYLVGLKINPATSPFVTQIEAASLNKAPGTVSIIVMKYENGMTLDKYLKKGPLSETVRRSIKEELRAAVKAIHKVGLIHADIKPSNIYIVLNEDGSYQKTILIDFGLSVMEGTVAGYRGTPLFATRELRAVFDAGKRGEKRVHTYIRLTFQAIDGNAKYQIGGASRKRRTRRRTRRRV
jgi:serine/threonine protein kinase